MVVCASQMPDEYEIANGLFLLGVSYLVPLVIITFFYAQLITFIIKHSRGAAQLNASQSQQVSLCLVICPSVFLTLVSISLFIYPLYVCIQCIVCLSVRMSA